MTDDQRDIAAKEGWIGEQVIIPPLEPTPDSQQAVYAVRVYVTRGDSHVDVAPEPPSVLERHLAMIVARQLLRQKFDQAVAAGDRRLLMLAMGNLTRAIGPLPWGSKVGQLVGKCVLFPPIFGVGGDGRNLQGEQLLHRSGFGFAPHVLAVVLHP